MEFERIGEAGNTRRPPPEPDQRKPIHLNRRLESAKVRAKQDHRPQRIDPRSPDPARRPAWVRQVVVRVICCDREKTASSAFSVSKQNRRTTVTTPFTGFQEDLHTVDKSRRCAYHTEEWERELIGSSRRMNGSYCWYKVTQAHEHGYYPEAVESTPSRGTCRHYSERCIGYGFLSSI